MSGGGYDDGGHWHWNVYRCEDCGIALDRHGEDCGFEVDDPNAPWAFRPAGWLNESTGEFTPLTPDGAP